MKVEGVEIAELSDEQLAAAIERTRRGMAELERERQRRHRMKNPLSEPKGKMG